MVQKWCITGTLIFMLVTVPVRLFVYGVSIGGDGTGFHPDTPAPTPTQALTRASVLWSQVDTLWQQHRFQDSIPLLQELIDMGGERSAVDSIRQKQMVSYYNWGIQEEQAGHLDTALSCYTHALAINPAFTEAKQALDRVKKLQGKGVSQLTGGIDWGSVPPSLQRWRPQVEHAAVTWGDGLMSERHIVAVLMQENRAGDPTLCVQTALPGVAACGLGMQIPATFVSATKAMNGGTPFPLGDRFDPQVSVSTLAFLYASYWKQYGNYELAMRAYYCGSIECQKEDATLYVNNIWRNYLQIGK